MKKGHPLQPRKKESKKWTSLPPDFAAQIKAVFEENFKEQLIGKSLKVEGRIYANEITLRVGINEKGRLKCENFEVSLDHSPEKQDTLPKIHLAVDAVASLMMDYFDKSKTEDSDLEESETDLPFTLKPMDFEKEKIWFQYTTENSDLDAEANKLLGLDEEGMLHEETDEVIGLDDSDEATEVDTLDEEAEEDVLDTSTPQMFGAKKKKEK